MGEDISKKRQRVVKSVSVTSWRSNVCTAYLFREVLEHYVHHAGDPGGYLCQSYN